MRRIDYDRNHQGGFNIAMKVPPHQFDETVRFYRDVVGLEPYDEKAPEIGFKLGPNRLWIDKAPMLSPGRGLARTLHR